MKDRAPFSFGWVIVGVSFITLGLAYGVWYSFSVFFVALLREFGWSRSLIAGAFSLFVILHSFVGPFVGLMTDRIGPKKVILLGSCLLGIGLAFASMTRAWWQFYLFFGIITAVGVGFIGWVPNITIIQQWFKEKRGLPIGIVSSGVGIGILVCVPSAQYLISRMGWRMTYRIMAILIPVVTISMAVAFLKRPPKTPQIEERKEANPSMVRKDFLIVDEEWVSRAWTVRQAMATKQFWFLGLSFFIGSMITHSILTHQVAFFVDHGLETQVASNFVGLVGIVSMGGKILWGTLSDRIGRETTYTMGITCFVFGMVSLILFSLFHSPSLPYYYALFFGMGYAANASLAPLVAADLFEGKSYGGIFGSLIMLIGIGAAFGAWLGGFFYDQVKSYVPLFVIISVAFSPLACFNMWRTAPRKIRVVPGKRRQIQSLSLR